MVRVGDSALGLLQRRARRHAKQGLAEDNVPGAFCAGTSYVELEESWFGFFGIESFMGCK